MKDFFSRQGIWLYCFGIVTMLLMVAAIVYGFDIRFNDKPGVRKAITSGIENSGQTNFFFKLDDKHAFGILTYDGDVSHFYLTEYTMNYFPFCLLCGWNMPEGKDFSYPYKKGDLIYSIEPTSWEHDGIPEGVFTYFDPKDGEIKWVNKLEDLGSNLDDEKYALEPTDIEENYSEISMSSADDEDCMIAMGAITLCYIILAVWLLISFLVWVIKSRKKALHG